MREDGWRAGGGGRWLTVAQARRAVAAGSGAWVRRAVAAGSGAWVLAGSGPAGWALPGPVVRLGMGEGAGGVVRDSAGGGADCDMRGARWVVGGERRGVELNGRSDYLEARDGRAANLRGSFTIAFWMKPAAWSDKYSAGIVSKKRSDAAPGYVIYADGTVPDKITLRIAGTLGGHAMLTSGSDVAEDLWQHWAVTHDAAARTVSWYRNGRMDRRYDGIVIGDASSDTPLRVGHAHTWNGYFDGALGAIEIYDRALTPAAIAGLCPTTAGSGRRGADLAVRWRAARPRLAGGRPVIAGCTVQEAGAKGDGRTDDTAAFQRALGSMARAGGGVVFAPAGRYAIRGNLRIPTGVTLRGEWRRPSDARGRPLRGTTLMAYAGRGEAEGRPFLALRQCSAVRDLAVWYPEQRAEAITPYPFCIEQMGSASGTVSNVTLVNAYRGIRTDFGSYLHLIHGVYGSPLSIGIEIDFVSDTGRVDSIDFGPGFWSASGLPGAPSAGGAHAAWMRANGTAMLFRRYEWIYSAFVRVRGYHTGVLMQNSAEMGETNGQMYGWDIRDGEIGADILDANFAGLAFTRSTLMGARYGVVTRPTFNSRLLMHSCTVSGGERSALLGGIANQSALFRRCTFQGTLERVRGDLAALGCTFSSSGDHVRLGPGVTVATLAGGTFRQAARIDDQSGSARVSVSPEEPPGLDAPAIAPPGDGPARARSALFVVKTRQRAPRRVQGGDDTAAIQAGLDRAARAGGGTVLLPAGIFDVRGRLRIPPDVELRGVHDMQHHTRGWGSVVRVFAGRGSEAGPPTITMERGASLQGLTFYYPEQRPAAVVPYPFLIQGRGADLRIENVTAANAYQFVDLRSFRCDRHRVDYAAGAPLRRGIAVGGGSVGGTVMNVQFNSHYWAWCPYPECPGSTPAQANAVWPYQYRNLEAFVFGDCREELQYQNTVFGSRVGLHFVEEHGRGASGIVLGHGTDGSLISMQFDAAGPGGVDVVNSQLVSMDCTGLAADAAKSYVLCGPTLRSTVRMVNSAMWGTPAAAVDVRGGRLEMDMSSFCMYGPLTVTGGSLRVSGAFLGTATAGDRELTLGPGGSAESFAVLSPRGMRTGAR